jgi:hypothetical protein
MCKNNLLQIRLSASQKEQLTKLADAEGFSTLSDYCRSKIFSDLSIHTKLNTIMEQLTADKK